MRWLRQYLPIGDYTIIDQLQEAGDQRRNQIIQDLFQSTENNRLHTFKEAVENEQDVLPDRGSSWVYDWIRRYPTIHQPYTEPAFGAFPEVDRLDDDNKPPVLTNLATQGCTEKIKRWSEQEPLDFVDEGRYETILQSTLRPSLYHKPGVEVFRLLIEYSEGNHALGGYRAVLSNARSLTSDRKVDPETMSGTTDYPVVKLARILVEANLPFRSRVYEHDGQDSNIYDVQSLDQPTVINRTLNPLGYGDLLMDRGQDFAAILLVLAEQLIDHYDRTLDQQELIHAFGTLKTASSLRQHVRDPQLINALIEDVRDAFYRRRQFPPREFMKQLRHENRPFFELLAESLPKRTRNALQVS